MALKWREEENRMEYRGSTNQEEIDERNGFIIKLSTFCFFLVASLIALMMWGCPKYDVWQKGLVGQAELKRAEWNRQIIVLEAKAQEDSAASFARVEEIRAVGIAKANKIIGDSLKGNTEYLRYLYIDMLKQTGSEGRETIYVPTEAGLPILEANRFRPKP